MKTLSIVLLLTLACGNTFISSAQSTNVPSAAIAPGAKLEKLAGDFKFTEGPTSDKDGNIFFTPAERPHYEMERGW